VIVIKRRFSWVWSGIIGLTIIFSLVWTLFPIFWMFSTSLKSNIDIFKVPPSLWPSQITYGNYENLGGGITPIWTFFTNSVITSLGTLVLAVVLATFAGYALSRMKFVLRKPILMGVLVTQMFPLVVLLIPLYLVFLKANLLNTYTGLILAFTSFTLPFSIWMIKGFVDSVPVEIEQAAMVDGCSRMQAMIRVCLPLIVPGIVATSVFAFLDAWNNLLFPLVLVNDIGMKTLPPGMIIAFGGEFKHDWGGMMAASTIVAVPVIIVFVLLQRYLVAGMTSGSVKG